MGTGVTVGRNRGTHSEMIEAEVPDVHRHRAHRCDAVAKRCERKPVRRLRLRFNHRRSSLKVQGFGTSTSRIFSTKGRHDWRRERGRPMIRTLGQGEGGGRRTRFSTQFWIQLSQQGPEPYGQGRPERRGEAEGVAQLEEQYVRPLYSRELLRHRYNHRTIGYKGSLSSHGTHTHHTPLQHPDRGSRIKSNTIITPPPIRLQEGTSKTPTCSTSRVSASRSETANASRPPPSPPPPPPLMPADPAAPSHAPFPPSSPITPRPFACC